VANLYTPKLRAFLDRRTQLRLSNQKAEELENYALAKGLCNGSPLAIQKIENRRDLSLRIMIYGVFLMVLAVGFVAVRTISEDDLLVSQLFFPIVSYSCLTLYCGGFLAHEYERARHH
jgi:hypothetical protein